MYKLRVSSAKQLPGNRFVEEVAGHPVDRFNWYNAEVLPLRHRLCYALQAYNGQREQIVA